MTWKKACDSEILQGSFGSTLLFALRNAPQYKKRCWELEVQVLEKTSDWEKRRLLVCGNCCTVQSSHNVCVVTRLLLRSNWSERLWGHWIDLHHIIITMCHNIVCKHLEHFESKNNNLCPKLEQVHPTS